MSELWIIEASGKKEALAKSLAYLGRDAKIFATLGHIMKYPDDLNEVGITEDFSEPLRRPKEEEMVEAMAKLASESTQVIIATDADQEGHVIAWDVYELLQQAGIEQPIARVDLRGVDAESIKFAIENPYEVTAEDAAPGRARAIVDRLLSATFSSTAAPVGRVTSGILGRLVKKSVALRRYIVTVPADDGGMPFRTEVVPNNRHEDEVLKAVVNAKLPPVPAAEPIYFEYKPENMGDLVVSMSDQAKNLGQNKPVGELAGSMQRLYEAGSLSYPRASARGFGPAAMARIRKSMFDIPRGAERNQSARISEEKRTHDAPYPLGQVSLGSSKHGFVTDNSVRIAIGQSVARSTHHWPAEIPDTSALISSLMQARIQLEDAQWLSKLSWRRWDGVTPPGEQSWVISKMVERAPDAALVVVQMEEQLGKPSTWISRAERMISGKMALVEASKDGLALVLTDYGRRALKAAPDFMTDPAFSRSIEQYCEEARGTGPEPWREIAENIVMAQPQAIRDAMIQKLEPIDDLMSLRDELKIKVPAPELAPRPEFLD